MLESAAYDILLILDTEGVAPPTVGRHKSKWKREWISSSGINGHCLRPGPKSFTSNLIKIFQELGDDPLSAAHIYYRLLRYQISSGIVRSTPIHAILSASNQTSIVLTPLHRKRRKTPHDDVIISFNLTRDQRSVEVIDMLAFFFRNDAPSEIQNVKMSIDDHQGDISRVSMRISLQDGVVPDTREWTSWLSSVPCGVMKDIVVDIGSRGAVSSESRPYMEILPFIESLNMSAEIADVFQRAMAATKRSPSSCSYGKMSSQNSNSGQI